MNPIVSVIMGAYNCEKTLEKAINSIINQSFTDWEFVICDDCSTDNTYEILSQYASKDNRIIVLRNDKNMRLAASLNNCLRVAKGKYVARMDADDESENNRLMKQVKFLEDHPDVDVVGTGRYIVSDGEIIGERKSPERPDKMLLLKTTPFAHPTIMMKKSVYDRLNGYNTSKETMRAEDLDLWFRFYSNGFKGYNLQEPLYKYSESLADYKKRSIKAAIMTSRIYFRGYRLLGFKWYKYVYALKPIVAAIIPQKLMYEYHKGQF